MTITLGFDYSTVDPTKAHAVRASVDKIRHLVAVRSMASMVEIGNELRSVKEALPHGSFCDLLRAAFGWTEPTARRFMNVASRFKSVNLTDVEMDVSAAYLLSAPSAPEDAVEEAIRRARSGERITHRTAARILQLNNDAPVAENERDAELDVRLRAVTTNDTITDLVHELTSPLSAAGNYAGGCIERIRAGKMQSSDLLNALHQLSQQIGLASDIIDRVRSSVARSTPPKKRKLDLNELASEIHESLPEEAGHRTKVSSTM